MKSAASLDWRIQALRAAGVRSARAISAALTAEGYTGCSASSVKRRLRSPRAQVPTPPMARPVARPIPTPAPVAPTPAPYVADEDAIEAHIAALASLIDRLVDEAVETELSDAEALADRWRNRAELAGWARCSECGQHTPPNEGDDQ